MPACVGAGAAVGTWPRGVLVTRVVTVPDIAVGSAPPGPPLSCPPAPVSPVGFGGGIYEPPGALRGVSLDSGFFQGPDSPLTNILTFLQ